MYIFLFVSHATPADRIRLFKGRGKFGLAMAINRLRDIVTHDQTSPTLATCSDRIVGVTRWHVKWHNLVSYNLADKPRIYKRNVTIDINQEDLHLKVRSVFFVPEAHFKLHKKTDKQVYFLTLDVVLHQIRTYDLA